MGQSVLKNILRFENLVVGVPAILPHGLYRNDLAMTPRLVIPSAGEYTITADTINVTVTRVTGPATVDVYVELWHSYEDAEPLPNGIPANRFPFIAAGFGGAGDGEFAPARTLFVAQSWPLGANPLVYFTTISAALVQAATLTPVTANHVNVVIFAGTYAENLTLVSNVNLMGMATAVNSSVSVLSATYTPAVGVNAPQALLGEGLSLSFMSIPTLTMSSTGKGTNDGNVNLTVTECSFNSILCTGRAGASSSDNAFFYNSNFQTAGAYTFTDMNGVTTGVEIVSTRMRDIDAAGDTTLRIQGGEVVTQAVTWNISGTAQMFAQGLNLLNAISVTSTAAIGFTANGCKLLGTLTVAAGSSADVRSSNYSANASLVGPGTINRTTWNDTFGPTAAGANAVVFAVPFPDTSYNVMLQLTAGPGNAAMTVTGKTGTGFTINDAVGGNTFSYSVLQE